METAVAYLKQLPSTKKEIEFFAHKLLAELDSGYVEALDLKLVFKSLEKVQEMIKDKLDELSLNEAKRYNEKIFETKGMKIEIAENGTKYHYKACNDSVYRDLMFELTELEEKIKKREAFLKAVPMEGAEIVNENTGEIEKIYPPIKTSKSGLKISIL